MRAMRADGARTDRLLVCGGNGREPLDAVVEMQCCALSRRGRETSTSWQPRWIQEGATVPGLCAIWLSSFVVQHRAVIGCIRERRMPNASHHLSVCFHASTRAEGWKPEHENQPGTLRIQAARCEAEPPSLAAAF